MGLTRRSSKNGRFCNPYCSGLLMGGADRRKAVRGAKPPRGVESVAQAEPEQDRGERSYPADSSRPPGRAHFRLVPVDSAPLKILEVKEVKARARSYGFASP
jgi:hypothetical protein